MAQIIQICRLVTIFLKKASELSLSGFARRVQLCPHLAGAIAILFLASTCQAQQDTDSTQPHIFSENQLSAPNQAAGFAGQFLAGLHAQEINDHAASALFFQKALQSTTPHPLLLRTSFLNFYLSGDLAQARRIAEEIERQDILLAIASEPAIAHAISTEDWQALLALAEKIDVSAENHLISNGLRAYGLIGQGAAEAAFGQLDQMVSYSDLYEDEVSKQAVLQLVTLQYAYLSEIDNRPVEASKYYTQLIAMPESDDYVILAAVAGLWRLDNKDMAEQALLTRVSDQFNPSAILERLKSADSVLLKPLEIKQAVARFLVESSGVILLPNQDFMVVTRAHLALNIWDRLDIAHMVLIEWYMQIKAYEAAQKHIERIGPDSPYSLQAQLYALQLADATQKIETAIDNVSQEIASLELRPPSQGRDTTLSELAYSAGTLLRRDGQCGKALIFFEKARQTGWMDYRLYRNLGICYEQTDQRQAAEESFDKALAINPNDAITLNYQGYWWADEGRKLEQAIAYIQRAVELRPNSGYYADSLGWIYYRLGDFDKAVIWLERAIQLTPSDPIISDHLADAYWQVGRFAEARFKWQHALDLNIADSDLKESVMKKIENGL